MGKPTGRRIQIEHLSVDGWSWISFAGNGKEIARAEKPKTHRYYSAFEAIDLYPGVPVYVKMPDKFYKVDI